MNKNPHARKTKLVNPNLQLRFALAFVAAGVVSVVVHSLLLSRTIAGLSQKLPHDETILMTEWPRLFMMDVLISLAIVLPLGLWIGIQATFPVAGAIYRIQSYFKSLVDGTANGPCKIRDTDPLHELCAMINQATAPLRNEGASNAESELEHANATENTPSLVAGVRNPEPDDVAVRD